ncbi:MAG: FHA domain-containing protein [Christensenellaceae bacterium]|jgi:hypothetical protein
MGGITIEKTERGILVINRLAPDEEVNWDEYNTITGNTPVGLLPVEYKDEKKDRTLSCAAGKMLSLRTYLSGIVSRSVFTETVLGLVSIAERCESNGLDICNLYLTPEHIFVHPQTKEIKCAFWPLKNNRNASSPEAFFRELPFSLVFNKYEDCTYAANYIQFFRTQAEPFSVQALEGLFSEAAPAMQPDGRQQEPQPYDPLKRIIEQKTGSAQRNVCPACGVTNAMGAKICVACGAALIDQGGAEAQPKTGTAVLGNSPGTAGTESEESPYPYLIRESTNQIISVDKPAFRIGKDKGMSDFCVSDNTAISRSHAVIHIREDRYFIEDQNSTNKTYIDGRAISPGQEVEIFPGAKIKLANEEFVFYI